MPPGMKQGTTIGDRKKMSNHSIQKMSDYIQKIFDLEIKIEELKQECSLYNFQVELYRQMNNDLEKFSKILIERA
jgi:cell shape-determining protein MreC